MKNNNKLKYIILIIVTLISSKSFAQQNLFNAVSSDITDKNNFFFQEQLNIDKENLVSNTTIDYGLGHNFEIGINLLGFDYLVNQGKLYKNDNLEKEALTTQLLLNAQKTFTINKHFIIGIGSQLGGNVEKFSDGIVNFSYLNTKTILMNDQLNINLGVYNATKGYASSHDAIGFQTGFEYKLNKKASIMCDYLSGKASNSVAVLGGLYYVTDRIPLSFGLQIPSIKSGNNYGFVFEFTYLPKKK